MYSGFPLDQVGLLRCSHDGGELVASESATSVAAGRILDGALHCVRCLASFPVQAGIVRMVDEAALDAESSHERKKRDEEAHSYHEFVADPIESAMEMQPMLSALQPHEGAVLFELGCGTGRYTLTLARSCRDLLAVDFSIGSLRILARELDAESRVGLVEADVARLRLAACSFDRGLSTLVSNLPAAAHRTAMYRLAAEALRPDGRFVFGTHHFGVRQRWHRVPREGYYTEGGIYRRYFSQREIVREVRPFFAELGVQSVQIPVPMGRRLRLPVVQLSQAFGRVPVVRQLGNLLLVSAARPVGAAAP